MIAGVIVPLALMAWPVPCPDSTLPIPASSGQAR
jgi:hypothetical protein